MLKRFNLNPKYLAIAAVVVVVLAGAIMLFKGDSYSEKLMKRSEVTNYYLEGNMVIKNNQTSEVNNYKISVSYLKDGDVENYRVSLFDQTLNQEQVMIRNKDGVYVLTPTLNQVFEFKGEWPHNGHKPYLYHSLISELSKEHQIKKDGDGYLITNIPSYPNMESLVKQEIMFTKDYKPVSLKAFAEGATEPDLTIEFTTVEFDKSFAENQFVLNDNMKKSREENPETNNVLAGLDLPVYPVSSMGNQLVSTSTQNINGNTAYILEFSGNKAFTIVQTEVESASEMVTTEISGEIVEVNGSVGIATNQYLTFFVGNKMYQIYSNEMSTSEKVQIASSMQVGGTIDSSK